MCRSSLSVGSRVRRGLLWLGMLASLGGVAFAAAPPNDMFVNATNLVGTFGSLVIDNTGATSEPGEPSHAGVVPTASVWYKWTAPQSGEVSLDTIGSTNALGPNLDTVLAVYTGPDVSHLCQVAANDDIYPADSAVFKETGMGQIFPIGYKLPYTGPSGLRFNATAGTTYYFAVDSKGGTGQVAINWAYHSAGVFRFGTEYFDFDPFTGNLTTPLFLCSPWEALPDWEPTYRTYYVFDPGGILVNVTRVGGSTGRMLVDYTTQDGSAQGGVDYIPASGTLVFDDYEMSKNIRVVIATNLLLRASPDLDFSVVLSNPRRDPLESTDVSPPRLDGPFATATVRIVSYSQIGSDPDQRPPQGGGQPAHDVYNFAKAHFYVPEDVNDYWTTVPISIYRTWVQAQSDGGTIGYRINNILTSGTANPEESDNFYPLQPGSDYAIPNPANASPWIRQGSNYDFTVAEGTVSFGNNDAWKTITFTVTNDNITQFNKDFSITLWREKDGVRYSVGELNQCSVTILFDDKDPPAGSVDEFHNPDHGFEMKPPVATVPPNQDRPGTDGPVWDMAVQPDGRTVLVGQFGAYNTIGRSAIVRVNMDGTLDDTFNPGSGADDLISSVQLLGDGRMIVAGAFTHFNGADHKGIVRLNANGSVDGSFNPGSGADGTIFGVAIDSNGRIIIGGDFENFNGIPRSHIARLNANGSLDTSFDPGANAPNDTVWSVAAQPNSQVVIGGQFTALGSQTVKGLARLNANGTADGTFNGNLGLGIDGTVFAVALQTDNKILVGGEFGNFSVIPRSRIARLNTDGTLDFSFDPGLGADDTVYHINPQANGTIYVGGIFNSFNGTRRAGFARIFGDGTVDTSFLDTAYNQFAGLHRKYYDKQSPPGDLNPDPRPFVYTSQVEADGHVLIGGGFRQVGGGQANANLRMDADYPVSALNSNVWVEPKSRDGVRNRNNFARLVGGATPGPGNIGLQFDTYSVNRSQASLDVGLMRQNGTLGYLYANFAVQPGVAQSGSDYVYNSPPPVYISTWNLDQLGLTADTPHSVTRMHSDGLSQTNLIPTDIFGHFWFGYNYARVLISTRNSGIPGDVDTTVQLANPSADNFYLGGENIPLGGALGRTVAPFTIVDDNKSSGTIGFATATFVANELGTNAVITIVRTNGTAGSPSVIFSTSDGTARAGSNYVAVTNKRLTFSGSTITTNIVLVPILDDFISEPNGLTINLRLSSVSGATLGVANAVLKIIDGDYAPGYVTFSSALYSTNESSGAVVLTLNRSGANSGVVSVQCSTTNGSALSGSEYVATTTNLVWNNGDSSPRYVVVPLIHDGQVGPDTTFKAILSNPTVNGTNNPATVLASSPTVADVTIVDDDYFGNLAFSAPSYLVNENGGVATVTVIRGGGSSQSLSVNYATADGTAVSSGTLPNFVATSGTLTFNPGEVSKSFDVRLLDDGVTNSGPSGFFFTVHLSGLTPPGASLGTPSDAIIYIRDAEGFNTPPGTPDTTFTPNPGLNGDVLSLAVQTNNQVVVAGTFSQANTYPRSGIARFNADSSLDTGFMAGLPGANGPVNAVLVQSDGRVVAGGAFTTMNGVNRNRLARLQTDGTLDSSFNPGAGADNTVFALAESFLPDRRLLMGGSFVNVGGNVRPALARFLNNGQLDSSFNPSLGIDGTVYAIAVCPTNGPQAGKIVIGGEFSQVGQVAANHIARLNPDGTLDTTFTPPGGANDTVRALAIQFDGKILVGGTFTNFNGALVNRFTRLNADGSLDANFNGGSGADDTVSDILIQPDNRIILAGQFTRASGVSRSRITRLLADGSIDPSINFGLGADGFISSVGLQPDGMLVVGGGFTHFDGALRPHLARLYGGSVTGAGGFEFTTGNFQADENSTNALVTIRRRGGTSGNVTVHFATSDGTAIAGINYSNVNATLLFPNGETIENVTIPVRNDAQITPDLKVNLTLSNPQPPAGLGNQPTATLTIFNDDSSVSFDAASYRVNENVSEGFAPIGVIRRGSLRGTAQVEFMTTTNGTAWANTNYIPVTNLLTFQAGQSNLTVRVPILATTGLAEGDKTVDMILTNANRALLFTPSEATLTIVDMDQAPGQFYFAQTNYVVGEGDGYAMISVLRTNGHTGTVGVSFNTISGSALPGVKYIATNGVLTFQDNETSKLLAVPIIQENGVEGNLAFSVSLFNPTNGATIIGPTSVPVTIIDDDIGIGFSSPVYIGNETTAGGAVTLTVNRVGTNGVTQVSYYTTNNSALAGTNYVPVAGLLSFTNGETVKTFAVPLLYDSRVTGPVSFNVALYNPTPGALIFTNNPASVTINDADPGLSFTNANFYAIKSGTNVLITVVRSNANTGIVSVNYATSDGTAQAGVDYIAANGLLTFSNGIAFQSFSVPIISNRLVQPDRTFFVNLLNPVGIASTAPPQLLPPTTAAVTITNDVAGLSFTSAGYKVNENGVQALISVVRTGYTNSTVAIDYFTADGTGRAGENYVPVSGTFVFTNGQTVKTFAVPLIDNSVPDGDKTVLLNLRNPVGNVVVVSPSAATLTIVETDGSLVVSAGTALTAESGPVNGNIDPGERISMLFAFRNSSGTNTGNLVATLLATNGITNPTGPQSYGSLVVHGPAAFRPFSFTANATNGQTINATFMLTDGNAPTNFASVAFIVGTMSTTYSNTAAIVINDNTNATPYPSVINISGAQGVVAGASVMLTNLNHTWPRDIDALLVSPSGQKSYLMAKAGSSFAVSKLTLTFDDGAAATLPQSAALTSGTFRPTSYAMVAPPFPSPAPSSTPASPYTTNLSVFNGSNPNGNWSLFVMDDTSGNFGVISNGWRLTLTNATPVLGDADIGIDMALASGSDVTTSNLTYTITINNYGPGSASGIVVSDTLPPGLLFVSSTASQGSASTNAAGTVTWTVNSLAVGGNASLTLVAQPSVAGLMTNTAVVTTASNDLNPDDNTASATVEVVAPSADLALGMIGLPNPVLQGDNVTYTITVTNLGPATATSVFITDILPPDVTLISASPAGYTLNGNVLTFANLGSLPSQAQASATIVIKPLVGTTITNTATCGSGITDPRKLNNTISVKTVVEPVLLSLSISGSELTISWPADATNYQLESATNLVPPVIWTAVTNPTPSTAGTQKTITLPLGSGTEFFRLHGQQP